MVFCASDAVRSGCTEDVASLAAEKDWRVERGGEGSRPPGRGRAEELGKKKREERVGGEKESWIEVTDVRE